MTTHLNKKNKPIIVDINSKKKTERIAIAKGEVFFSKSIYKKIQNMKTIKGEIDSVAIVAGIMGAKKTSEIIPLCHNISIENVSIDISANPKKFSITVLSEVKTNSKTGVEMEALTSVSIACLTIYDMCKSLDKSIKIKNIELVSKKGGKSDYKINKN